ncbi:MAG: hypothetical protein ABI366_03980 [Ginsengibacter sp.]
MANHITDLDKRHARGGENLPDSIGWYLNTFYLNKKDAKKMELFEFIEIIANSYI